MKVYFKNLDGIRFIAAFLVILQHTTDYKAYQQIGLPNTLEKYFTGIGGLGVTLFFVLSGFLIFYLLFSEHKVTSTIHIKNFYIRRILRIWPLYFGFGLLLILGIDYFFSIHTPVLKNLFFLFTFSVNLQLLFTIPNKGIIELYWSVCIEEQFYLMAPWLVKKGMKRILWLIFILIGIGIVSRVVFHYLDKSGNYNFQFNPIYFFTLCRFDNFGVGALAAYLYFDKTIYARIQHVVENKLAQALFMAFTFAYVFRIIPQPGWLIESTLPPILFALFILSASTGNFIFNLENALMRRLGKYSYGIYIFHAVICQFTISFFIKFIPEKTVFNYDILYPVVCVLITAIVAGLSYELYEKHFLKLKQKFTIIKNHGV